MTGSCPYCRAPFEPADVEDPCVLCTGCGTAHHAACLAENGGCTVFGCSQAPVEEPKISVSSLDLNALTAPPPPRTRIPVPPPPRRTESVDTSLAEPIVFLPPEPARPTLSFAGYAGNAQPINPELRYVVRRNRVAYVVLAIFFGPLGVHNFYAGYIKKAVIQCCLTVFTFSIASPFVWIWAVVEACRVDRDDDGVLFT
ncbi:MAG: NINE protein [Bryocella sp.]